MNDGVKEFIDDLIEFGESEKFYLGLNDSPSILRDEDVTAELIDGLLKKMSVSIDTCDYNKHHIGLGVANLLFVAREVILTLAMRDNDESCGAERYAHGSLLERS